MNESPHPTDTSAAAREGGTEAVPSAPSPDRVCPSFSPEALRRQLVIDGGLWWLFRIVLLAVLCFALIDSGRREGSGIGLSVALVVLVGLWMVYSLMSARVARQIPRITEMIETESDDADLALAGALGRRPLQQSLRLLLYHRLAMLRHRRRRFGEVAAICQEVLAHRLGAARMIRPHLLLMLVESRLECGDQWGTWAALGQLRRCRLSLMQLIQLTALQTRYEVGNGYFTQALHELSQKLALIELMPAPQCGLLHAILAVAARNSSQQATADWLQRRAELLCGPE